MKRMLIVLLVILIMPIVLAGCAVPAPKANETAPPNIPSTAAAPAKWEPTRMVTMVLGNSPGSAYDSYARGIVAVMKKYVGQEIIIKNVIAAGGVMGTMQLYRSKPDGYTIGLLDMEKRISESVVSTPDFDISKFVPIATCNKNASGLIVAAKSPYKNVADLKKASLEKPVRISCASVAVVESIFPLILDLKFTYVSGYGSSDAMLAVMKGDADCAGFSETAITPFAAAGDVRPILFFSDKKSKVFEDAGVTGIPIATEAGYPELAALVGMRTFMAPPGAPPEIQAYWEDKFMTTMRDPELLAWAKKAGAPIDALGIKDTMKGMQDMLTLYTKWKDVLKKYVQ